jgi:hypothetical protein
MSVAFSKDAGDSFGPAIQVDRARGGGQVTVPIVDQGHAAIAGWLEGHETWARWVGEGGQLGTPVLLGPAPSHSRLPRWISSSEGVLAAWTQETQGRRTVQMARLGRKQ